MKTIQITGKRMDLSEVANLAIQFDHETDTVKFILPSTYDGKSLPTSGWGVRYQLSNTLGDIDLVEATLSDGNLEMEYSFQGGVVSRPGLVSLALQCIQDGKIVYQTVPGVIKVVRQIDPSNLPQDEDLLSRYLQEFADLLAETSGEKTLAQQAAEAAAQSASNAEGFKTQAAGSATAAHESEEAAKGSEEGAALIKGAIDSLVASAPFQAVVEVAPSIPAVAEVAEHIPAVAGAAGSIPTVAGVADELALLAPVADEIAALALIVADITSVSGVKADVTAVAEKLVEVQAVYAKLLAIEAVAGRTTEIDALYAQLDTIAAKANQADLEAVEIRVDSAELALARQGQDLASVKQTLQQGNGATLDFSGIGSVALDARATGRANPTVEGRTATNVIPNSDFSTSDLSMYSLGYATAVLSSGQLILASTAPTGGFGANYTFDNLGHAWLVIARIKNINAVDVRLRLLNNVGTVSLKESTIITMAEYAYVSLLILPADYGSETSNKVSIRGASSGVGTQIACDKIFLSDLTLSYGSTLPTVSDCAKIFSYFDGTKSIQMPAMVRSVGKNMLPPWVDGAYSGSTGVFPVLVERYISSSKIKVDNTKTYVYSSSDADHPLLSYSFIHFFNQNVWIRTNMFATPFTITPAMLIGVTHIAFSLGRGSAPPPPKTIMAQLELGSTATPYEPYKDSTLYIADDSELLSVPAIADKVKVFNGELVKVQNVQRYVLQASDIALYDTISGINANLVRIARATLVGIVAHSAGVAPPVGYHPYLPAVASPWDATANIGKITQSISATYIDIIVAKGTYADLASAKAALAGTVIYYQLATPTITPLLTSGILQAKPKGTVYFEPYYEGSHQTDASSQITLPYTGTIDKLTGYDENLEPYEIPSTGYTLVGTLLTITGAEENEVFYVELSRSEPLVPMMSVNVLNNDQVTLDSVNGKYYKITFTAANGVPTTVATEVV